MIAKTFPQILINNNILFKYILFIIFIACTCNEEYCYINSECNDSAKTNDRFLLYDVNPPEGFNLRRDVYMRFAVLAHKLRNSKDEKLKKFKLVLPPWSHLVHWKYSKTPEQIPWGLFFDLDSLKSFAPVIEMHEFFNAINKTHVVIDEVYVLQHFEDMFETGNFEDRMTVDDCLKNPQINYFFYKNMTSHNIKCLSYHGPATKLSKLLQDSPAKVILLHHAEVALHEMFGGQLYWQCRRSMRFNSELERIAGDFRREHLNSTDELSEKPKRSAKGGPYLAVHLRRRDFLRGRSHQVPSVGSIAKQIIEILNKNDLNTVFVATDAVDEEFEEIVKAIPSNHRVLRYTPSDEIKTKYKDGGVAIIDQIICSHARHFMGTYESTFTFRIQEEREILGFPVKTTFNSFCKDDSDCPQSPVWKIVY